MLKKIRSTVVSKKFGIVLTNLSKDWQDTFFKEFKAQMLHDVALGHPQFDFFFIKQKFGIKSDFTDELIKIIAKNVVVMKFGNFEKDKMLLINNCTPQGTCETDYCEKFFNFLKYSILDDRLTPIALFSLIDNDLSVSYYSNIRYLRLPLDSDKGIEEIKVAGKIIDNYIKTDNDFFELDFLINAFDSKKDFSLFHIVNTYSILECLLQKKDENIDFKLSKIFSENTNLQLRKKMSIDFNYLNLLRRIRNKIAHGDFISLNQQFDEYEKSYMAGFDYDLYEYSRQNWILIRICLDLEDIQKTIIKLLLHNKDYIKKINNTAQQN